MFIMAFDSFCPLATPTLLRTLPRGAIQYSVLISTTVLAPDAQFPVRVVWRNQNLLGNNMITISIAFPPGCLALSYGVIRLWAGLKMEPVCINLSVGLLLSYCIRLLK